MARQARTDGWSEPPHMRSPCGGGGGGGGGQKPENEHDGAEASKTAI
jgi:hypothetical protein